ncbi:hypothetical protein HNQ94_001057 [Salirhabdus euzebyi]|uniref:DUF4352 domain-containing protein n=1 Tax=Salirhabdus euzebyi TaxID=394506 RepID=A0A841PZ85_9BACI|nr:hypothetical protein [Salirhabdus euzebyi]MBB6452611.1 hypothetical protein [Salirhabdus euzebyi]
MKKVSIVLLSFVFILFIGGCGESPEQTEQDENNEEGVTESAPENEVEEQEQMEKPTEEQQSEVPFYADDFVVEIIPNGNIDSAGGVEYSYNIQNNSDIPVQEFSATVKLEFEDGQTMTEDIDMYTTILAGESIGDSNNTVYPEPASLIKSYEVIAYNVLDAEGTYYEVDLQLETADIYEYGFENVIDDVAFNIEDFTLEITPNGNIDSAGGVEYSYNIENNSPIPAKQISFDVKMTFENGVTLVEDISVYDTLMNGDSVGESNATVYPEPASPLESYKIIGYEITDKDDYIYDVDTQLNIVTVY